MEVFDDSAQGGLGRDDWAELLFVLVVPSVPQVFLACAYVRYLAAS